MTERIVRRTSALPLGDSTMLAPIVSQFTPRTANERLQVTLPVASKETIYKLDNSPVSDHTELGFAPRQLVLELTDSDWKIRSDAVEKLLSIVCELHDATPIIPHLGSLVKVLNKLLFDSNFTICLTTIRLTGELITKMQTRVTPALPNLLPNLIEKFGDSKIIIRQETLKVVTKLMTIVTPTPVIDILLQSYENKHWVIKLNIIHVVIKAFLTFKDHQFEYTTIVPVLTNSLKDSKPKVKQAAIELLAVIKHTVGSQLEPMLAGVDADNLKTLHKRFARSQLPVLAPDGTVEFGDALETESDQPPLSPSLVNAAEDHDHSDPMSRPARHWSAGAKVTPRAKLPPWFPSSPVVPNGMPDEASAGAPYSAVPNDIRQSIYQRSRSLSMTERLVYSPTPSSTLPPITLSLSQPSPHSAQAPAAAPRTTNPSPTPSHPHQLSASDSCPALLTPMQSNTAARTSPILGRAAAVPEQSRDHSSLGYNPSFGRSKATVGMLATSPVLENGKQPYSWPGTPTSPSTPPDLPDAPDGSNHTLGDPKSKIWFTPIAPSLSTFPPSSNSIDARKERNGAGNRRRESPLHFQPVDNDYGTESSVDTHSRDPGRKLKVLVNNEGFSGYNTPTNQNKLNSRHLGDGTTSSSPVLRNPISSTRSPKNTLRLNSKSPNSPGSPTEHLATASPTEITPTEQLTPFDSPEQELKLSMDWFAHGEWYQHFEAITTIRRLAVFHPRIVVQPIHGVLLVVLTAANSLRSLVSRHALVCLGDMFKYVGKYVEPHLDEVVFKVLKKYNDSNNFLEKELDRAMGLMLQNVSESRALSVMLQSANHKSVNVRVKVATFVTSLLEILGGRVWEMREVERVVPAIVQFAQEGSGDARAQGRKALLLLYGSDAAELDRLLKKHCTEAHVKRVTEILDKIKLNGEISVGQVSKRTVSKPVARTLRGHAKDRDQQSGTYSPVPARDTDVNSTELFLSGRPSVPSSFTPIPSKPRERKVASHIDEGALVDLDGANSSIDSGSFRSSPGKLEKDPPELDQLSSILSELDSSDWRARYAAIGALMELATKFPVQIASKLQKIFDHFVPRLTDGNSKVNMVALHSLKQFIQAVGGGLDGVLTVLIPSLAANLAASKQEIRILTLEVLELLVIYMDNTLLVPHLAAAVVNHANTKVKVALLQKLADIIGTVYIQKPTIVVKYVLPLTFRLLDERKGELRAVNRRLLQALFKVMGNSLWENTNLFNLSKQDQTKLHEILIT